MIAARVDVRVERPLKADRERIVNGIIEVLIDDVRDGDR
jgi:hypothetical protein